MGEPRSGQAVGGSPSVSAHPARQAPSFSLIRRGASGTRPLRYHGLLLVAIVAAFVIQGVASPDTWALVFVTALLGGTLMLSLWIGQVRRSAIVVCGVIVAATIIISLVEAANGVEDPRPTRIANALLVALAPPAIIIGLVRTLRATRTVTLESVFGVLSVYLLLGMFFAAVYGALDRVDGQSFFAQGGPGTASRCLYFSFTTLTTVGYGDLTARSNLGHTLSVSEALLGQIYLVTVVSLIVANLGRRREPVE